MTDPNPQGHPFLDQVGGWPQPDGSGFINLHWARHLPDAGPPKSKEFCAGEPFRTRRGFVDQRNTKKAGAETADADRSYRQSRHRGRKPGGLR